MNSSTSFHVPKGLDVSKLPKHVAIIMDGNGRWAEKRLMNRIRGHEAGAETVRTIVKTCREIGIPILTLYAFSTENWTRPKLEIEALMNIFEIYLQRKRELMVRDGIRLDAIGDFSRWPQKDKSRLCRLVFQLEVI